jgi:hypothetical protein
MTLPFPAGDQSQRQYVCFVCGMAFKEYPEYSSHITEQHEEGRDYVRCPLARCRAPIRDVIMHYKARHPSEPLPKTGMLKALVWADKRAPSKRKKKPRFKDGFFKSIKNGGKEMHYRSGWEHDVYRCLEVDDDVMAYHVESFRVEYYFNGKTKGYYPDILVHFADNHFEVWEIKPTNQHTLPINQAKWTACKAHCLARGWGWEVINETSIKLMKMRLKEKYLFEQDQEDEDK